MRTTKILLFITLSLSAFSQCSLVYNPFTNQWNCGGASGTVGGASNLTTVGAIPYVSAAGILNQDPTALFWDAANNRLGVGTNAPGVQLHVRGGASGAPMPNVSVTPSRIVVENSTESSISILSPSAFASFLNFGSPSDGRASGIGRVPNSSSLFFYVGDLTERMRIATTGNLLIGTTTDNNFRLDIATSGSSGTFRVYDQTATTGSTKAVFRNGAGQTGSLIEIQTSGGTTVGTISTTGLAMASVASDGNLFGAVHQVANSGRIDFSNGSVYSQSIRRRSDAIIAFDNNTAIGTTPGNARDVMVRGVYAAETTSDPSAGDLSIAGANAQDTFRLYMKNDKLVVAYQISGTVNYLTIPLDGATTTWTQSTTAP